MKATGTRWHFDDLAGVYDGVGNPTPTLTDPLTDGGQVEANAMDQAV